jgi:glycosyltransferase involved in cell wall biosynthesis
MNYMMPELCLFTDSLEPSGMGEHLLTLAAELRDRYRITLVGVPTERVAQLLARGEASGLKTWALERAGEREAVGSLARALAERDFDIFHCHAGIGWEGHAGVRAAHLAGIPAVVRTEHLPYLLTDLDQRAEYAQLTTIVDRIITVSEEAGRGYLEAGVPASKLRVVLNGIDQRKGTKRRLEIRAELGLPLDARLVLTVGRMTEQKGHRHLLHAVPHIIRRHPDAYFLWGGVGPLWDSLRREVRQMGLEERVHFLGQHEDVADLMCSSDLFVLPSLFEGLPLCALEAMDAGLPIVGTRVCGTNEVVEDGVTGLLVEPGEPVALAHAVNECLHNTERSMRWGDMGRVRALQRFTAKSMAHETSEVYSEVLAVKKAYAGSELGQFVTGM